MLNSFHCSGTLQVDEDEFAVNNEFQDSSIQLADALDLDEIESAKLLLNIQDDAELLGRSGVASATVVFHERRQFLLECLRMLLRNAESPETHEPLRQEQLQMISEILEVKDGHARNGSLYVRKCFKAMADSERWLHALTERYHGALALGQPAVPGQEELLTFQQLSLGQQHESLGAIVTYLIKGGYTAADDFFKLLEHLPTLERWNHIAVHYVPAIAAFTSQYGSPENGGNVREARMLHRRIMGGRESSPWALHNLQAAAITWWLAEYSGWYQESQLGSPIQGADLEAEARGRSEAFVQALRDGALQCTLSICSQLCVHDSSDPARNGLTQYLLGDTPSLSAEVADISPLFRDLLMVQMESFVSGFITNMPDTLRQFQSSEDDQRKKILGNMAPAARSTIYDQDLHLERFLLIIAYAFDRRVEAAEAFWADPDGNLYGFLQWASKRQSTPRVGAFCEMLRSISQDEESATAAHHFLLDESNAGSTRIRRSSPLSWSQILSELNLYGAKVRESPTTSRPPIRYGGKADTGHINEPESALMLECYLRFMAHVCRESSVARSWLWAHETVNVMNVMFTLADGSTPPRLQACAFAMINSMLVNKTRDIGSVVWTALDQWASNPNTSALALSRPGKSMTPNNSMEEITFEALSRTFDQANEFVALLQNLVHPGVDEIGLNDALPFPEQLGAAYRMAGMEPYVDFVFGRIFTSKAPLADDLLQARLLTNNVLNFAATCLATFNENLVVLANQSTVSVDTAIEASSLAAYARLHPFSRVMEWFFNDRVLSALFAAAKQDINDVGRASPTAPIFLIVLRAIEIMNRIMDLQSTYFEIVRPLVKLQSSGNRQPVLNPTLASFEDSVVTNLDLIVNLGLYSGLGNQELATNSLKLLEKLASSRRLNAFAKTTSRQQQSGNRLVGVLEQDGDLERVRTSFILAMQYNERELAVGPDAPGWTTKCVMLDFLNHCLTSLPDRPNVAHALLGLSCTGSTLSVDAGGAFARQTSLFHSVVRLAAEYPEEADGGIQGWLTSIRHKSMGVLSTLRASRLTFALTMTELREADFLFAMFLRQAVLTPHIYLDGFSLIDPSFVRTPAVVALEHYLEQRCFLLEYSSSELRLVEAEGSPTLKARILSTLFGSTTMPDGAQLPNVPIFDLLDVLGFDFQAPAFSPLTKMFETVDFSAVSDLENSVRNEAAQVLMMEQLLALRLNELRKNGYLDDGQEQEKALIDAEGLMVLFKTERNVRALESIRSRTLQAWSNLLTLAVGHCDLDQGGRASLILQSLQTVTPKLEQYAAESSPEALILAKLVQALLFQVDFTSSVSDESRGAGLMDDRLFHVFRNSLRAINIPEGDVNLREVLYNICFRYLSGIAETSGSTTRQHSIVHTIKTSGKKVIDTICDDAYGGSGTCRASAVLFLDALTRAAKRENSSYMIDSLSRTNFIVVLVEAIRDIPNELRDSEAQGMSPNSYFIHDTNANIRHHVDIPLLLSYYDSKLALLLAVSQTRPGATQVINAGLFQTIRESGLFSADPDLGICTCPLIHSHPFPGPIFPIKALTF